MRLVSGTPAPTFRARTWQQTPLDLEELRGKKIWLAFFRYASCPLCNLRVREMYRRAEGLHAADVLPIAVFQSPAEKIRKYVVEGDAPPIEILADPDQELYALYGLESKVSGFFSGRNATSFFASQREGLGGFSPDGPVHRIPADFLIGRTGALEDVFYGDAISDHIPLERVETFAAR